VTNTANDLERVQKLSEPQIGDNWGDDEKPHPHGRMPPLWFVGLVIENYDARDEVGQDGWETGQTKDPSSIGKPPYFDRAAVSESL
jgi:hypothetical protein